MDHTITERTHLDHVDLLDEEVTLSDGSKVYNVVIRTSDGYFRFLMTDEKSMIDFVSDLKKVLNKYGDKMIGVDLAPASVQR